MENSQLGATVAAHAKRCTGASSSTAKSVPLASLRLLKQKAESGGNAIEQKQATEVPSSQEDNDHDMFAPTATSGTAASAARSEGTPRARGRKVPQEGGQTPSPGSAGSSSTPQVAKSLEEVLAALGTNNPPADRAEPCARHGKSIQVQGMTTKQPKSLNTKTPAGVIKANMKTKPSPSGGQAGKKGGVTKIMPGVRDEYQSLLHRFEGLMDLDEAKEADEFEALLGSTMTTWGKKKGALLSSRLIDDADDLVDHVTKLGLVKKAINLSRAYSVGQTPQHANALIAHIDVLQTLEVLESESLK